jgi:hypothetical protein
MTPEALVFDLDTILANLESSLHGHTGDQVSEARNLLDQLEKKIISDRDTHARQMAVEFCIHKDTDGKRTSENDYKRAFDTYSAYDKWFDTFTATNNNPKTPTIMSKEIEFRDLTSVEDAGAFAVGLSEHLSAQQQGFFVAGFQECYKYLIASTDRKEDKSCPICNGMGWHFTDEWIGQLQERRKCQCASNPKEDKG